MDVAFWTSLGGVVYAYFGYPVVLIALGLLVRARKKDRFADDSLPSLSIIIPAHNEAEVIGAKLENMLALPYGGEVEVIVVSDGSTDSTEKIVLSKSNDDRLVYIALSDRKGKANALNQGVGRATGEIVVFSDASIILDEQALIEIVQPFSDPEVGCVSGEDKIAGSDGEGLYGRYELFLRRMESRLGSIVGASGSFYAQRRELVQEFPEGVAPDFLSVLNTVKSGSRAVSSQEAFGHMTSVSGSANEFKRKVRTLIRGMTALFRETALLNPIRYPLFAFFLLSHKVLRWLVPVFLLIALGANIFLLDAWIYQAALVAQAAFYGIALLAMVADDTVGRFTIARVAQYFCVANAAILVAWVRYLLGARQEIWGPTKRASQD